MGRNRLARYFEPNPDMDPGAIRPGVFAALPAFMQGHQGPSSMPYEIYRQAQADAQRAARLAEIDPDWFTG